jgi:hypothetical protein
LPILTIAASVNQDLWSAGGHHREQAVGVDASKGLKQGKEALDWCRQLATPKSHFRNAHQDDPDCQAQTNRPNPGRRRSCFGGRRGQTKRQSLG